LLKSLRDTVSILHEKIDLLATQEKVSSDAISARSDEITAIHASVNLVDQGISEIRDSSTFNLPLNASQLLQATQETDKINKRRLSVILTGLPERDSDLQDFLSFIHTHHQTNTFASDLVLSCKRLSKPNYDGRPRFLRIMLHFEQFNFMPISCPTKPHTFNIT